MAWYDVRRLAGRREIHKNCSTAKPIFFQEEIGISWIPGSADLAGSEIVPASTKPEHYMPPDLSSEVAVRWSDCDAKFVPLLKEGGITTVLCILTLDTPLGK
jgi:hypothetical protein